MLTVTDNGVFLLGQVYEEEEERVAGMKHIFQDNNRSRSENYDAALSDCDTLHAVPSSS
jgi:hypothetical protein